MIEIPAIQIINNVPLIKLFKRYLVLGYGNLTLNIDGHGDTDRGQIIHNDTINYIVALINPGSTSGIYVVWKHAKYC